MTTLQPAPILDRLLAIQPGSHRVVSCYVRLAPQDRARQRYVRTIKARIKSISEDPSMISLDRDRRLALERDLARVIERLENPRTLPPTRGLAVFASEELDLLEVVPLPKVHRVRLIVDDTPWVRELVAAQTTFGRVLAVVLDRRHARFFEATAFGANELPCIRPESTPGGRFHSDRGDAPGRGERLYHGRLEEEHHRHYAGIVDQLDVLVRERAIRGLVLAGPAEQTVALARFLPSALDQKVLGTARLNPTAVSPAQVEAAVAEASEAHDRTRVASMIAIMEESLGTGWALNGPRETLRALADGKVRTLFIREDLNGGGFRCGETGRLVLAKGECRGEGKPIPVLDVVDEAVEEALRQHVEIVVAHDTQAAEAIDGLAAILRFR